MKNEIHEQIVLFIKGFSISGFGAGIFMFGTSYAWMDLVWQFPLKLFGTVLIAVSGGLATLIMNDIYKHKMKPWMFKKLKIKEKEEKEINNE